MSLSVNTITFGKYKGKNLEEVLKDRKYCKWLVEQEWFEKQYEYLYNSVNEYKPLEFFLKEVLNEDNFLESYRFFNLKDIEDIKIDLNEEEIVCYKFYRGIVDEVRDNIIKRKIENEDNIYDIKAPSKYLKKFEKDTGIDRDIFKTFLYSYELPNITKIIEDVKKEGGIDYKGGRSYLIAKENSLKQEKYWEDILKDFYKDKISSQFIFKECIFDFINIELNTIFECKLGIKDFSASQYKKYINTLDKYNVVYLIDNDCIIDLKNHYLYTTDYDKYLSKILKINDKNSVNKLENVIKNYQVVKIDKIITGIILVSL